MAASTQNMTMGRFIWLRRSREQGCGAGILTSRHGPLASATPGGPAGLRAEALRLEEANHQPQRPSARNPHRSLSLAQSQDAEQPRVVGIPEPVVRPPPGNGGASAANVVGVVGHDV